MQRQMLQQLHILSTSANTWSYGTKSLHCRYSIIANNNNNSNKKNNKKSLSESRFRKSLLLHTVSNYSTCNSILPAVASAFAMAEAFFVSFFFALFCLRCFFLFRCAHNCNFCCCCCYCCNGNSFPFHVYLAAMQIIIAMAVKFNCIWGSQL